MGGVFNKSTSFQEGITLPDKVLIVDKINDTGSATWADSLSNYRTIIFITSLDIAENRTITTIPYDILKDNCMGNNRLTVCTDTGYVKYTLTNTSYSINSSNAYKGTRIYGIK